MSENNQFENILPVAPLKIAALESCREFARKVDRYLVSFRETANTQHRITYISRITRKTPIWSTAPVHALAQERQKDASENLSAAATCSSWWISATTA